MSPRRQEDESSPPLGNPAAPCILPEDVIEIKSDIREIKNALTGTRLGPDGIIPRLNKVEEKAELHDRKLLVWGAILSAAGVAVVFIKDLLVVHKP